MFLLFVIVCLFFFPFQLDSFGESFRIDFQCKKKVYDYFKYLMNSYVYKTFF